MDGICGCPAGQELDENGVCYTPEPEPECENGRELVIIQGVENCLLPCPEGVVRDPESGQCINQCAEKAGQTFTTSQMAGGWVGCYGGCVASCAIGIGSGGGTFSCTYTGGTCEDDGESPDHQVPEDQQPQGPSAGDGGPCGAGTSHGWFNGIEGCYGGGSGSSGSGGNTGQPSGGAGGGGSTEGGGTWHGGNTGGGSADSDGDGFADGYGPGGGGESENGQSTMPDHTETDHGTFADVLEEFYQDLYQTRVIRAIDGLKRSFGGSQGTPPTPSFQVFGQTFTIDFHVQLMESGNVRAVLYAVFTLLWVVVGIRIIASA